MSESVNIFFSFYPGSYLKRTLDLSTEEHGAYFLLLLAYYSQQGPLPDDDVKLARITRMSPREWSALRPRMAEFFRLADGRWHHDRCDQEIRSAIEGKQARSQSGRKAAAMRWHGRADAVAVPTVCPSPSPTDIYTHCAREGGGDVPDGPEVGGFAEAPSLEEAKVYAAGLPAGVGVMNGLPTVDPAWVADWHGFAESRVGWARIHDWRRELVRQWRKQHRDWARRFFAPDAAENGAKMPAALKPWEVTRRIKEIDAALADHPGNPAGRLGGTEKQAAKQPAWEALREERRRLVAVGVNDKSSNVPRKT